jgi:hypothetical protein
MEESPLKAEREVKGIGKVMYPIEAPECGIGSSVIGDRLILSEF